MTPDSGTAPSRTGSPGSLDEPARPGRGADPAGAGDATISGLIAGLMSGVCAASAFGVAGSWAAG
jgi:sugar/nucleoside kinase (ribokinase family)